MSSRAAVILSLVAILAAVCQAQDATYTIPPFTTFPYCKCQRSPGAYSLEPTVVSKGNVTYCFKVRVTPPVGCQSACCTKADLKKLELNIKPSCRVPGASASATINGAPTKVSPMFDRAALAEAPDATVLKLTQLGLNRTTANGTEICITLKTNNAGLGCTTLEDLCVPPEDAAPGTCTTALFDSADGCCPGNDVRTGTPCRTCVYYSLTPNGPGAAPYNFSADQCASLAASVSKDMMAQAAASGAAVSSSFSLVSCEGGKLKICGDFASAAESAKLRPFIDDLAVVWLSRLAGEGGASAGASCPPELSAYTVALIVGADGGDPAALPPGCLEAVRSTACKDPILTFPACACNTTKGSTPFAVSESDPVFRLPGRRPSTQLHCFTFKTVDPMPGPCAAATSLNKVEFWANEDLRGRVLGFSLRTAGSETWRNISAIWGARGDETLKATAVNWSAAQARGGQLCVEMQASVPLEQLCRGPSSNTCWVTVFDSSRTCCPLYPTFYS